MRVLHKGLFIVAVPFFLELAVLLFFGMLLNQTDKLHEIEVRNRRLSEAAIRQMFTQLNVTLMLLNTWQKRDLSQKIGIEDLFAKMSALQAQIHSIEPDSKSARKAKKVSLAVSAGASDSLRAVNDLADDGFTLENFLKLKKVEHTALANLDQGSERYLHLYDVLLIELLKVQGQMNFLEKLQLAGSIITSVLSTLIAAGLIFYYRRSFVTPIRTINENVIAYAGGEQSSPPLNGSDEIVQFDAAFHQMINQLQQATEREQSLFENSNDIIGVFNNGMCFLKVNAALTLVAGYSRDEVIGQNIREILAPSSAVRLDQLLCQAKELHSKNELPAKQSESIECELELVSKSGKQVNTRWSIVWLPSLQQWCFVARDVSEEKKLTKLKEEFLQLIANDLQKPLESISHEYNDIADGIYGTLPEQAIARVQAAIVTLNRMVSLVGELLQLERLKGEIEILHPSELLARELIETAVQDLSSLASAKQLVISIDGPAELRFCADGDKILRVLVNLLSNAIKFSPQGQVITIKVSKQEPSDLNARVKFEITDNGPGMTDEGASKLFKAYSQLEHKHGKRGEGTGLGLLISQRLVEQHGGQIGVESALGSGSTFWFTIPLQVKVHDELPGMPDSDHGKALSESESLRSWRDARGPSAEQLDAEKSPFLKEKKIEKGNKSKSAGFAENLSLWQKAIVLIAVPLSFQIAFSVAMLAYGMQASSELSKQVREHSVVQSAIAIISSFFKEIVIRAPKTPEGQMLWSKQLDSLKQLPSKLRKFEQEASADELTRAYATGFTQSIERELPFIEQQKQKVNDRMAVSFVRIEASVGQQMEKLLDAVELRNKLSPETLSKIRKQQAALIFSALLANVLIAGLLATFFGLDISKRILILADNTDRFSKGLPLLPALEGKDEIAQLDHSFHEMSNKIREAREKESAFLNSSANLICSFDNNFQLTVVNASLLSYTQKDSQDLMNSQVVLLLPEDEREAFTKKLTQVAATKIPVQFETRFPKANNLCDLLWSVTWSEDQESYFCIAYDVSQRKDLERMHKEFVALISHDLRAPITTISGTSALFLSGAFGDIPQECKPVLAKVQQQCAQIIELVNDLLELEKFEAKQMNLILEQTELLPLMKELAKSRGIEDLRGELREGIRLTLDLERINFALSSLLNEIDEDAIKNAWIELRTEIHQIEQSRCLLCIHFEEEGTPVSRAMNGFGPTEKSKSGSRLKIPLAIRIIEAHGGTVRSETDNKIRVISIELPIQQDQLLVRVRTNDRASGSSN